MRSRRPLAVVAFVLFGFLVVLAFRARPADPASRLPARYRLADLIQHEERVAQRLRGEVERLRADVRARQRALAQGVGASDREPELQAAGLQAGLVAVTGPGMRVVLDDSDREPGPGDNVNDLVVHSEDVQAVVNALWRSGAEALAINGQRLVSTSAVLCVGNTLLLNGTVHSPPFTVFAVGADRLRFDADPLVRRFRDNAEAFGLRFSVEDQDRLVVPAYAGSTQLRYARPVA
jgi:uncharacterized protein YlxW (UPF0749 family)